MNNIRIDINRLSAELLHLAKISDAEFPAVTRVMLSDKDLAARKYFSGLCEEVGLKVRVDAAGNIYARWVGRDPNLPAVATGSHTDAIPEAGMYDGTVGMLGGLEAIRAMQRAGLQPKRSVELVMFTSEEPTRYGVGCFGTRLMSGVMSAEKASALTDREGVKFGAFYKRAAGQGSLAETKLAHGHYQAFVELHIEQGPLLEKANLPIGVVTAIAALAALRVTFEGAGGHAGAVLMPDRRDALLPAAKLALAVDAAARATGAVDTVATTGVLDVYPRAINSIPSRTYLEIDVRDTSPERRDGVLNTIREQAAKIGNEHNQKTTVELINADPPATCAPAIVATIEKSAADLGLKSQRMISRAYHDSLFMAQICPTAMIFIPCRDGVSHRPDEYSSPEAISAGVAVLARTLAQLAT